MVLVTHPTDGADAFARALVGRRLAACVNAVSAASTYRWEGEVEEARETLLLIKTSAARLPDLERAVAELHPYDVPEIVALAPERVARSYLDWVLAESGG